MSAICAIFDLDGTLVDSEMLCNRAFLDLLPELSETVESLVQANRGKKLASILARIERVLEKALPADFEERYRARVASLFDSELTVVSGVREMLEAVGFAKCVASSGPPHKIRQALKVAGIAEHFGDRLFSSYEVGLWKPDPGLFLHAANAMGFAPSQCVVIEDSEVGVSAGIAAGMRVFQFLPHTDDTAASGASPFSSMSQLPDLLVGFETGVQQAVQGRTSPPSAGTRP
jgi:HAD superfamily hydrolase (TIGR01509 family)